jgi:TPR repeat protein
LKIRILVSVFVFLLATNPFISFANTFSDGIKAFIKPDHKDAVKKFRISALKGDKNSQHSLGLMLYKGFGVKQDYKGAFKWLNLAAKQGHSQAKLDLAIMIFHKKGLPNNYIDEYK